MPKISQDSKVILDNLYNKVNKYPFEVTVSDYITINGHEVGDVGYIEEIKADLDEAIQTLPDKYDSIIIPFESDVMYLLDELNLIDSTVTNLVSKKLHVYSLHECMFNNIHCHKLSYQNEGSYIFSKSEINELKQSLANYPECQDILKSSTSSLNGVYIEYHDHLSMDAFYVWVYKDGVNLLKSGTDLLMTLANDSKYKYEDYTTDLKRFNGIQICMMNSSSYYGTMGLRDVVKNIKQLYPDLDVKCFSIGWYTFPREYRPVGDFFTNYLSSDVIMIEGKSDEYFKSYNND